RRPSESPYARPCVRLMETRRWQRDTVARALRAALRPSVARRADGVEIRPARGGAQVVQVAIDFGGESRKRNEPRDIDRDDEMPGVGLACGVGVEVDDVAAEGGAVEGAGQEPEHERKPTAFVAADRQQQAVGAAA